MQKIKEVPLEELESKTANHPLTLQTGLTVYRLVILGAEKRDGVWYVHFETKYSGRSEAIMFKSADGEYPYQVLRCMQILPGKLAPSIVEPKHVVLEPILQAKRRVITFRQL